MTACLACALPGCIDKSAALQLFHRDDAAPADVPGMDAADDGGGDGTADAPTDGVATGVCAQATEDSPCDDGNICTGVDLCKSGICSAGRGLVSSWRGNGNANDSAGLYDGTASGAAGFSGGIAAQAFSFPAQGAVNFGSDAGNFGTTSWTIELWVKSVATTQGSLLSKRDNCGGYEITPWWDIRTAGGRVQIEVYTTQYHELGSPGPVMNDGAWHHVVFVRIGDALSLYQDGVLLGSTGGLGTALNDSTAKNLVLGSGPCIAQGNLFTGELDEISLYHRALTAPEVAAQANGQCIGVANSCQAGSCAQQQLASLELQPTTLTPPAGQSATIGLHVVAKDASGQVITGPYSSSVTLWVVEQSVQVSTLTTAGTFAQDPANPASFNSPTSVGFAPASGASYILASSACHIYEASDSLGLQWIGGAEGTGFVDDSDPMKAHFYYPASMATVATGGITTLYILDKNNGVIRKMNPGGVSTFAGTPCVLCGHGFVDGIGTSASFNDSWGIALAPNHDLLVADTGNGRIRRVSTVNASVTTLTTAGTFLANPANPVLFTQPLAVAGDAGGKIYVGTGGSDDGGKVYRIAGSQVTVLAGGFGSAGVPAVTVAADGTVFLADPTHHVVRAIAPDFLHTQSVVAGLLDQAGATDGNPQQATFTAPAGLAVDPFGTLRLGDTAGQVRRIDFPASLALSSTKVSDSASADAATVTYGGTGLLARQVCASASGVAPVCVTIAPAF